jgi:hypothetical protein
MKNGYRSHRGRSAIARKVIFSATGKTDGMMPQGTSNLVLINGKKVKQQPQRWGGGDKKGGSAPSATGQMRSFAQRNVISAKAKRPNLLFIMKSRYHLPGFQRGRRG